MEKYKQQIPNALTVFRIILIPVFIYFALNDYFFLTLVVFVVAALTDTFDGVIARKFGYVSNFGKIVDPLADKLLVASALVIFSYWEILFWWLTAIILLREVCMTIYRELLKKRGIFLAANRYGKIKTTTQMVTIIATLAYRAILPGVAIIDTILIIMYFLIAALAWMSAIIYIYQVRKERHGT